MAGDARHASHVDADGRQDTAGPSAPAEPLVARGALRHRARTDLVADPLRRPHLRGRLRLHRPQAAREDERGRHSRHRPPSRSEEHTSELQSRFDLVCRLLLEKKNQKHRRHNHITLYLLVLTEVNSYAAAATTLRASSRSPLSNAAHRCSCRSLPPLVLRGPLL